MFSRIPKRFSLRTMLLLMAVVAVAAYLVRDHYRVRNARADYEHTHADWSADLITLESLIGASETLAQEEAASPWVSMRRATDGHIQRMIRLLYLVEFGVWEVRPEELDRRAEFLKENIRKHQAL